MPKRTYGPTTNSKLIGYYKTDYGGNDPIVVQDKNGYEDLIWSQGHWGWQHPPGGVDKGGSFLTHYVLQQTGYSGAVAIQGGTAYAEHHYHGLMSHVPGGVAEEPIVYPDVYGATLYNLMKPDRPDMSGLNAIYELKDVPEMLRQRFLSHGLAEIGNYYLALKFGWEALLSDVLSFVLMQQKAQKHLKWLLQHEGKPVRRAITLSNAVPTVTSQSEGTGNVLGPSFVTYFYRKDGHYSIRNTTTDTIWGSARFRYWLPGGPRDVDWTRSMMARIFGAKPTPSTVYKAIPWSWLIDWFTNAGDCIANLETSIVDRLAADYFYVMRQRESRRETTVTQYHYAYKTLRPVDVSVTSHSSSGSKCRMTGDPFGWGSAKNSLSGVQLAILGALGLSRLG